jgi:hypothetical protein
MLMDAHRLPFPAGQGVTKRMVRSIGDLSWLVRSFPRLSAYKLVGANWTIVFVGAEQSLKEIRHLFFQEASQQELGRIALWKLSKQTQQWLAEGTDLVVCELGRIHPKPPSAVLTFTIPTWIQQVVAVPGSLDALISGGERRNIRHKLRKADKFGFSYEFSQSKADFDNFYYHMYVPFAKARHADLALVTPYQDQWERWFVRGGLVLVTKDDEPVAGILVYMAGDVCYLVEMGYWQADPRLLKQEISTVALWYAATWACEQGAKFLDLGGSLAWNSNGPFVNKRRWGARVVRRKRIYGSWTFLAQDLSPSLQDYINKLGFISEINARFYSVLLNAGMAPVTEADANKRLLDAKKQGLDGLLVVFPNSESTVYDVA